MQAPSQKVAVAFIWGLMFLILFFVLSAAVVIHFVPDGKDIIFNPNATDWLFDHPEFK